MLDEDVPDTTVRRVYIAKSQDLGRISWLPSEQVDRYQQALLELINLFKIVLNRLSTLQKRLPGAELKPLELRYPCNLLYELGAKFLELCILGVSQERKPNALIPYIIVQLLLVNRQRNSPMRYEEQVIYYMTKTANKLIQHISKPFNREYNLPKRNYTADLGNLPRD